MPLRALALLCALAALDAHAARRALLIGINDYTATTFAPHADVPQRDWPNLAGARNDVMAFRELLVRVYGFAESDVVTLTDQRATRIAILSAIHRSLVAPAQKDDTLFFYFAGHGSQVRNSRSGEPDRLDESIVPADSRAGADDIRDKELRRLFNRALDRGAKLTIFLDECHSGSGARGVPAGLQRRGIRPDPRDVRDGSPAGPRPEDRGALVLAATQDFDAAWETRDALGNIHGTFSWAWLRALRDAAAGESATDTFLRAQARMRAETPYQDPVLAGDASARVSPFLGPRRDRREGRTVVAVERVRGDGTVVLRGGWINGLAAGSTLRSVGDPALHFTVTAVEGLTRSEARGPRVHPGALLEATGWAAPPARPLRIWIPQASAAIGRSALAVDGIEQAARIEDADYVLGRRLAGRRVTHAWIRPHARASDKTPFPVQTAWTDSSIELAAAALRLRKIQAWQSLESPPDARSPYHLVIRRARDGAAMDDVLPSGEAYGLALQAVALPARVAPRYFYVFVIDSDGRSTLLYPPAGSVENRFPLQPTNPPLEIPLGERAAFEAVPPYGADTYVLLSCDEPLPNPWIVEWEGVRAARVLTWPAWSIERRIVASVAGRAEKTR